MFIQKHEITSLENSKDSEAENSSASNKADKTVSSSEKPSVNSSKKTVIDVTKYLYLPDLIAHIMLKELKVSKENMEDIVAEGTVGLLRAASLYDPDRNSSFNHFATCFIKDFIKGAIRDLHSIKMNSRDIHASKLQSSDEYRPTLKVSDFSAIENTYGDFTYEFYDPENFYVDDEASERLEEEFAEKELKFVIDFLGQINPLVPYVVNSMYGTFGFEKNSGAEIARFIGIDLTGYYRFRNAVIDLVKYLMRIFKDLLVYKSGRLYLVIDSAIKRLKYRIAIKKANEILKKFEWITIAFLASDLKSPFKKTTTKKNKNRKKH